MHVLLNTSESTTRRFQVTPQSQYTGSDLKDGGDLTKWYTKTAQITSYLFDTKKFEN